MSRSRDAEYTEYVAARLSSLRRLAAVLCDDWQRTDDLVQATLTKLYVHWGRVRAADHADAYARAVLVREFIHERRSAWVKRVSLSGTVTDSPAPALPEEYRGSPRKPVYLVPMYRRDAVKIADHIRYGAATPPLLFPVQLTHLPSRWRVSSLTYQADAGVLRVGTYALGAGPPNLGADGGLEYPTNLPYFIIGPATRRTNHCYAEPHQSIREIINGYRVVLTTRFLGRRSTGLDLCAAHADGLTLFISEPGAHPPITPANLFRNHLRLLGANPANWTRKPIG